jgi:hypothetical protein
MKHPQEMRAAAACVALSTAAWVGLAAADNGPSSAGVELPGEVVAAASVFSAYVEQASGVDSRFSGGESVAKALRTGASYEPAQLQEGMIGFGALAALQDGRFVSGIEAAADQAGGRQALAERIAGAPYIVLQFDGAAGAAGRVEAALHARGVSLFGAGSQVKQAAYKIQHQAWSTVLVADGAGRLAEVKSLSASRRVPSDGDNAHLIETAAGPAAPGATEEPRPTNVVVRALALAAEADLGAARNEDLPRLQPLLADESIGDCLRMSKLNLYQCMAVAGPQYEDVFCLGQHALMDTGQCLTKAAGEMATAVASPIPAPGERPYLVPVARRSVASTVN